MTQPASKSPSRGGGIEKGLLLGSLLSLAALIVAPQFFYSVFVMKLMCYALFAATFNLLFGYVGLLSFGHAMFFGTGAYIGGLAAKMLGFGPLMSLLAAIVVAAVLGVVVGYVAIKRKGIEFAMITLALAELVAFIVHRVPLSGGENGLQNIPRGKVLGLIDLSVGANIYGFVLAVFVLGMFVLWLTVHSPFGHILKAIREHEARAMSLGYDVSRFKLIAFVISAGVAGLAGATKSMVFQFASLEDVSIHLSGQVILMTLLGGLGRFFGPLVGAAIVVALESYLASSSFPAPVVTGLVFVACVMLFRRGVVGEIAALIERK